jgi:hypothetical protein
MKNILYIHQYFKTPPEGGALRSYFIAREMVNNGMKVQMISAHNKSVYEIRELEGILVHYLPVRYSNEMPFVHRYIAFLKFVIAATTTIVKTSQTRSYLCHFYASYCGSYSSLAKMEEEYSIHF